MLFDAPSNSTTEAKSGGIGHRPNIVWITVDSRLDPSDFGWKSVNLCALASLQRRAPEGFSIARGLVTRIAAGTATRSEFKDLQTAWTELVPQCPAKLGIVRSSSSVEHARANSFAGLFDTVRNVNSFDALIAAIKLCHASANSPRVERYARLRGTQLPSEHMAVLVQRQISIRHAALIQVSKSGYLFEAYEGELSDRILGQSLPEHVVSFRNGQTRILRTSDRFPQEFFDELRDVARDVQCSVATHASFSECLLEVASDGRQMYVLQLNLIGADDTLTIREPSLSLNVCGTVLENASETLGVKGAAMQYFREADLFDLPLQVFPPATSREAIGHWLREKAQPEGYTVRFSHKADLGLPRSFKPDSNAVIRWLQKTRRPGWATIIHPLINVRASFEMLLTADSVLLERIPGMWESDNHLDPDVVMIDHGRLRAWTSLYSKTGRFASFDGFSEEVVAPTSVQQVRGWADRIAPVLTVLRRDFRAALPLNIHFVEDAQQRWFFLNVRRGFSLESTMLVGEEPHVVRDVSDLDLWDRHAPILLRFTTERGGECRVLEIAERLMHRRRTPILIDFGVLSHPALVLRELGFTVIPTYLQAGGRLLSPSYQTHEWMLDRNDDAVMRIRNEPALYHDDSVRIIPDREPIVPGHLLVLAEEKVKSFADGNASTTLTSLFRGEVGSLPTGPWILVERGRARFCTSGMTEAHAHAHLLPAAQFDERAVEALAAELGATRYGSFGEALLAARLFSDEYVLAATSAGPTYLRALSDSQSLEKRHIRKFFTGQIR